MQIKTKSNVKTKKLIFNIICILSRPFFDLIIRTKYEIWIFSYKDVYVNFDIALSNFYNKLFLDLNLKYLNKLNYLA